MNIDNKLLTRTPRMIGEDNFRTYSVLVPFVKEDGQWYVIFEKRTENLRKNPGEICFPGGRLEENETHLQCAVRETMEELKIEEEQIEVIGVGDIYISPFQLMVHPYLATLSEYQYTYSEEEVATIIKIPLNFLLEEEPRLYQSRLSHQPPEDFPYEWIPKGENYPWVSGKYNIYFYHYEEHIIWGMTAHILHSVIELLKETI